MMATNPDRESLGTLFSSLSTQIGDLVRQQATLARVEVADKLALIERRLIRVVIGAVLATGGVLTLMAALVLGVAALGVAPWASATLVGALLTLIGYIMTHRASTDLGRGDLKPQVTINTLKESTEWAKHPTRT